MRKVVVLSLLFSVAGAFAHDNYTGRSGAPGRQTCASSCHGGAVVNAVQVLGFPTSYTPGQAYLLTIKKMSGGTIVNFNASCRVGLNGTTNAGTISSGQFTSTYNVSGETNGVHFTVSFHDSGQFTWTAPVAGTGVVRLYAGALQTSVDGDNNTIVLTSNEAVPTPAAPQHLRTLVEGEAIRLYWSPSANATLYNVYRDSLDVVTPVPAHLIGSTPDTTFVDLVAAPQKSVYVVTAQ